MSKISTIDADSIRKHPANNSPSKLAYQFSKSKRFPDINPEYLLFLSKMPQCLLHLWQSTLSEKNWLWVWHEVRFHAGHKCQPSIHQIQLQIICRWFKETWAYLWPQPISFTRSKLSHSPNPQKPWTWKGTL